MTLRTPQPHLHSIAQPQSRPRTAARTHDSVQDVSATASLACQSELHSIPPDVPYFTSVEVLRRPLESTQYTSYAYQRELGNWGMLASFTGTGACLDNAYIESFFATLKKELVYQSTFATREEARLAIFEFVEVYYNRWRLHSSLGYQTPNSFEMQALEKLAA